MLENYRRVFNRISQFFDRKALTQSERQFLDVCSGNSPLTARKAFEHCHPVAKSYDSKALLKSIVGEQDQIQTDGSSTAWSFGYDLPKRQAQLLCTWYLATEKGNDEWDAGKLEVIVNPFPAENSSLRQFVEDGRLLYSQLKGMWKKEMERNLPLPLNFHDTDSLSIDLIKKGRLHMDTAYSLNAVHQVGKQAVWVITSKEGTYEEGFNS